MGRVMVIGGPGSGKTWLARRLGEHQGLPVISIDAFVHDGAGQVRPPDQIDADSRAAADGSRWIVEGGNSRTYDYRASRADCIIWLNPPRLLRLWRVMRRDGWNWRLLVWTWHYDSVFGPRDRAVLAAECGRVAIHELNSGRAVDAFLATNAQPAPPHHPSA
ncbi:hypothetical protein [uncultured Devosia sp.]|uniref:hypothetical protein n=1 Tax=uncultured Devosia sp. TaxID=211434 RepID=UPI00261AB7E5|nr:hypothetical protein [uncultured Devosia sp.]